MSEISKHAMRKDALARRDATDAQWRIEASLQIAAHVDDLGIDAGEVVSGFWPIRSEVDVRPLLFALGARGNQLALPVVLDRQTIIFRQLVHGAPLVDTGFGTVGPSPEAAVLDPTVMLVPLAAFDAVGNRIGYGAGYYDRAIARLAERDAKPRLIGVAFGCQQVEAIPAEMHDEPLDGVLTEHGYEPLGV